ncbi:YaaC family protein [Metabacillus idriensis]|uniref:YaaC family protein n=1 Tax=Metabacillus idriensis TaxID=324768 RepID=UPI002813074C|nr:YaaC family protein [Metabacillus idriensis]MDR0140502.1 YaaC family protein [Metabacillus idriensis]
MMKTDVWNQLKSYQSTETVQKFLEKCYKKNQQPTPAELSYQNSYPFVYHLKHAENFYLSSASAALPVQPMLLFYGMSQLMKSCILTLDHEYPATSSVLAHGVSTRKRKKQQYRFLQDEVKIQRNGLFAHAASHLFKLEHVENDKYSMQELLKRIPELSDLFSRHKEKNVHIASQYENRQIHIPVEAAASYHMTPERLLEYLNYHFQLSGESYSDHSITCHLPERFSAFYSLPFLYNGQTDDYTLPASLNDLNGLPEFMAHYLLLYNLSMISRYETEWWYELMLSHSQDDYVFIVRFLEVTKEKIPQFALAFLNELWGKV